MSCNTITESSGLIANYKIQTCYLIKLNTSTLAIKFNMNVITIISIAFSYPLCKLKANRKMLINNQVTRCFLPCILYCHYYGESKNRKTVPKVKKKIILTKSYNLNNKMLLYCQNFKCILKNTSIMLVV